MKCDKDNGFYEILICVLLLTSVIAQGEYYDERFDYYDIDHLIKNRRLLKKYLECFLERGPCTPIGREFREILPEVVVTACKKCTPPQRSLARKTFSALETYFPDTMAELLKKLDPKDKYYPVLIKVLANA